MRLQIQQAIYVLQITQPSITKQQSTTLRSLDSASSLDHASNRAARKFILYGPPTDPTQTIASGPTQSQIISYIYNVLFVTA